MDKHQYAALLKAWNEWHKGYPEEETPAISLAFEKGFEAGMEYQAKQDAISAGTK